MPRIIPALSLCILIAAAADGQDWRGASRLSGRVVGEDGKAVSGAVVRLRHADSQQGPDLKTDSRGEFAVLGLRGGRWNIDVESPGFLPYKISVSVPDGEGRLPPVEIKLSKDKGASQAKELQGLLAKGDQLFEQGKFAEARAEYEKVAAARPDIVEIHRSIAFTYGREGNHAEALKHLDMVLQTDPSNPNLLQLAISSALQLKDVPRAEKYLAALDDSKVKDATGLINVGIALLNGNQPEKAVAVMDRTIARFPNEADAYYFRALGNMQLQKLDAGKADLEKFVTLAPPDSKEAKQARDMLEKMKK